MLVILIIGILLFVTAGKMYIRYVQTVEGENIEY